MSMQDYDLAVKLMEQYKQFQDFVGSRSEALVVKAESALGVAFPPTYRRFLREYGAGSFTSHEFYGIVDDNFTHSTVPNGVWMTLRLREEYALPEDLLFLQDGGGLDYDYYIKVTKDACPIITYTDALTPSEQKPEIISEDFAGFFLWSVKEGIQWRTEGKSDTK